MPEPTRRSTTPPSSAATAASRSAAASWPSRARSPGVPGRRDRARRARRAGAAVLAPARRRVRRAVRGGLARRLRRARPVADAGRARRVPDAAAAADAGRAAADRARADALAGAQRDASDSARRTARCCRPRRRLLLRRPGGRARRAGRPASRVGSLPAYRPRSPCRPRLRRRRLRAAHQAHGARAAARAHAPPACAPTTSSCCCSRSGCSPRSPPRTRRWPCSSSLPTDRAAVHLRPRARRQRGPVDRAQPLLPRHRAAAVRPARGRRRVHRPPHAGRGRAVGLGGGATGCVGGAPAPDRDGRAAARHRQDPHPRRDHQQARPAGRRRVGADEDPHDRGPEDARPRRRHALQRRPRRARVARALRRRRLPRRPRRHGDPARPRGSSPSATPSTP